MFSVVLRPISNMIRALREHWPEYLLEAAELGIFMISAGLFTALLEYPGSPVHQAIRISDMFVVFRQDEKRFLRKVCGVALIFCQRKTKSVKSGIML
jgi:hypothetical protein